MMDKILQSGYEATHTVHNISPGLVCLVVDSSILHLRLLLIKLKCYRFAKFCKTVLLDIQIHNKKQIIK